MPRRFIEASKAAGTFVWSSFQTFVVTKTSSRSTSSRPEDTADALLVAVDARRVDVPVADLEGAAERGVDVHVRDLPDTETDLRDGQAGGGGVAESERGC